MDDLPKAPTVSAETEMANLYFRLGLAVGHFSAVRDALRALTDAIKMMAERGEVFAPSHPTFVKAVQEIERAKEAKWIHEAMQAPATGPDEKPLFFAEGNQDHLFAAGVEVVVHQVERIEGGKHRISLGFPVCEVSEYVGSEGVAIVVNALNAAAAREEA
jgi:hypothetical protein